MSDSGSSHSVDGGTNRNAGGRPASSERAIAYRLLATLAAVSTVAWGLMLAATFTERLLLILPATLFWLTATALTTLFLIYLGRRRRSRSDSTLPRVRELLILAGLWCVVVLAISNWFVDLGQRQTRLWTGFLFDREFGWYPEPNLVDRELQTPFGAYRVTTDAQGHRNPIAPAERRARSILLQGDSNTFGFGLKDSETLAAQLNSRLKHSTVYNYGIPGFDLNQYYYQYQYRARQFAGALRIIHFNIGNDFTLTALETPNYFRRPYLYIQRDAAGHKHVVQADSFVSDIQAQGYGHSFVPPYHQYDHLIQATAYDWADLYPRRWIKWPLSRQLIKTYHPKLVRSLTFPGRQQDELPLYNPDWLLLRAEDWPEPFRAYRHDFKLILKALRDQPSPLLIVPFPFREQILQEEREERQRMLTSAGYRASQIDPLAFNKYLAQVCEELEIRLVDPTPRFQAHAEPGVLYLGTDQHLSAQGISLCVDAILESGVEPD